VKRLLVLGAGTAGTMVVNRLRPKLDEGEWTITIVDEEEIHYYQPGFLFIPFGALDPADVVKATREFVHDGVEVVHAGVELVDPENNTVTLADGRTLEYDELVIATGTRTRPDQTEGLLESGWRDTIHDFYTFDGAVALHDKLRTWEGGRLVVNIMEMPFKCPVAPMEFSFLADAFFREKGMRDRVELVYVTPLDAVFTKPIAAEHLSHLLDEKGVHVETDFYVEHVEPGKLVSYDEREVPFDLLVTIPVHMGAEFVAKSGLGDELNHVPVDKHNFQSKKFANVWAIGDAADLPTSKAGSVAHFSVDVFAVNFVEHVHGRPMPEKFDGHAICFVETGNDKGLMIDFNYETEPLPGKYPIPKIGPFSLLEESKINHMGKMAFRWAYWNVLLPGRPMPMPAHLTMAGKYQSEGA